jgi:hypothetical protein
MACPFYQKLPGFKDSNRSPLAAFYEHFGENGNATAIAISILEKNGRVAAARLGQEMMDDGKEKVASLNFETIRVLTEKYYRCKKKGWQLKTHPQMLEI